MTEKFWLKLKWWLCQNAETCTLFYGVNRDPVTLKWVKAHPAGCYGALRMKGTGWLYFPWMKPRTKKR